MSTPETRSTATRFQQRTIDYVTKRFWIDRKPAQRFLVADEVGLGKTMVAREVVAEALRRQPGKSVDIVYLCSSQPVASQNLRRLKVHGQGGATKATRLTLLATEPRTDGVRYFALTPDTSFKVTGRSGTVRERALIFVCLRKILRHTGFKSLMQQVSDTSWKIATAAIDISLLDKAIIRAFQNTVQADIELADDIRVLAREIRACDPGLKIPLPLKRRRDAIVGVLRKHLALHSAAAIAANGLVIVDEFQRFSALFDVRKIETDIAVQLVDRLLSRDVPDRRVLLLSATPYRIPGGAPLPGEAPYADFVDLVRFLANERIATNLSEALDKFGQALRTTPHNAGAIMAARDAAKAILLPIMCRTERTGAAYNPNAMVQEDARPLGAMTQDLSGALSARRIARGLKARDPIEYWKSAPYFFSFMRDYQLRTAIVNAGAKDQAWIFSRKVKNGHLELDRPAFRRFEPLTSPPSARFRDLIEDALPPGSERLLWTPPSLPYLQPTGIFEHASPDLKRLIFTEWRLAPDAIAALTSYVVEQRLDASMRSSRTKKSRRAETGLALRHKRFGKLGNMLRLGKANQARDQPTLAMVPLVLLLSGKRMAEWGDALSHAVASGQPVEPSILLRSVAQKIRSALKLLPPGKPAGRVDERWYWAAPLLIEGREATLGWLSTADPFMASKELGWSERDRVMEAITAIIAGSNTLGRKPRNLVQVLAKMAIAGPGYCAYRALRRTASGAVTEPELLRSAFHIARGFQSLFNQGEAAAAVQLEHPGRSRVFWDQTLDYCLAGNLQALLDEHLHFEADGLAMFDGSDAKKLEMAAAAVHSALTLRRASIDVRSLQKQAKSTKRSDDLVRLRCRHAARFAEVKEADGSVSRLDAVRGAFNSPFRPFVLASTAVGQEGLDFHPWCHAIVHWNLPRSPVELEQREGRVHRYKGHAVRLNIASAITLGGLNHLKEGTDPWQHLFQAAASIDTDNELSPCWLFEQGPNPVRIKRIIPYLRFSREEDAWPRLRARLATYRLAIGLPRAEDLMDALERNGVTAKQAAEWKIDLRPPRVVQRSATR